MVDKIVSLNEFVAGTGANSIKMNQNFNETVVAVNDIIDEIAVLQNNVDTINVNIQKIVNAIYIGQIVPFCRSTLPTGVLPCDGSQYTRALFPTFFRDYLLTGKVLTCSYEAYDQDLTDFGFCGKFAIDGINNTFRTPTLTNDCFFSATNVLSDYGKSFEQGLPDITGSFNIGTSTPISTKNHTGAFKSLGTGPAYPYGANATTSTYGASFKASDSNEIYGASNDVTPKHIKYPHGVVVANISEGLSEINWNEFLNQIENKLDKPTIVNDDTSTAPTIGMLNSNTIYNYSLALTSLTITNYEVSHISSSIWFTAGAGFSLTFTNPILGWIPEAPTFEDGAKYVLTINNGYAIVGKVSV